VNVRRNAIIVVRAMMRRLAVTASSRAAMRSRTAIATVRLAPLITARPVRLMPALLARTEEIARKAPVVQAAAVRAARNATIAAAVRARTAPATE